MKRSDQSAHTKASTRDADVGSPLQMPEATSVLSVECITAMLAVNAGAVKEMGTRGDPVYFVHALSETLPAEARGAHFRELVDQLLQALRREKPGAPLRVAELLTDAYIERLDRPGFFRIRAESQIGETLTLQSLMITQALPNEQAAALVHDAIKSATNDMAGDQLILCILCAMSSLHAKAQSSPELSGMKLEARSWAQSLFQA